MQVYQAAMTAAQQAAANCSPLLCIAKPDLSDPLLVLHDLAALARLRMEGAKTAIAHFMSTGMPSFRLCFDWASALLCMILRSVQKF